MNRLLSFGKNVPKRVLQCKRDPSSLTHPKYCGSLFYRRVFSTTKHEEKSDMNSPDNINDNSKTLEGVITSEAEVNKELLNLQDRYLRTLAEMENLRNRTQREVEAAHQFALQKFVRDLLPVADTLELAFASIPESNSPEGHSSSDNTHLDRSKIREGLQMTLEELKKVLSTHGVSVIDPLHQKFDPNLHQAVLEVENNGVPPRTIVAVHKKGYLLHGRVIRAAVVSVAKSTSSS